MIRPASAAALLLFSIPARGEPLTLDDALAIAARVGGDVQLSRLEVETAQTNHFASYAGVLPRLDLSLTLQRSFYGAQSSVSTVPVVDPTSLDLAFEQQVVNVPASSFPNYGLSLTLQQPLFDGRRNWSLIERSQLAVTAAQRQLDEVALSQSFEVIRRFYEVLKAERSERVLAETVERSEELVRRSQVLFEAGRLKRGDVIAAQVNLGTDRINLAGQRARGEQARADLAVLLARSPADPFEIVPPTDVDGKSPAVAEGPPLAELLARAHRDRPLLSRYRELLGQAALDRRIASADRYPSVSAGLSYGRSGPTFAGADGVFGNPARQFVATGQVLVQWNLFNGRLTSANEQRAEIGERQVGLQAEAAMRQVDGEVARSRASVVWLAQEESLARENLSSAEEGVRLARERLDAGAATQLEVRDAALKLTLAKLTLVNTRIDRVVARADLARAVGGSIREAPR
jgi:outer membrane protein